MPQKRVMVAMSGGIDSSVTAVLLKEAGYDVSGIYMQLPPSHDHGKTISDLEQTCRLIDIPLHIIDFQTEFQQMVIDHFCQEYSLGRTPNPCIICNQQIKFGLLLDKALLMGADYLAAGHYARTERSPDGYRLLKAVDLSKDQSYFLYTLGQRVLRRLLLPLGNFHKQEVRKLASRMGLSTNNRHESQDICFISDNDYHSFITRHSTINTGDIVSTSGKVLGNHKGLAHYTIGQRQGLGLASNERLYVIKLDGSSNRLIVGTEEQLFTNNFFASKLSWVSGEAPSESTSVTAKVRYKSPEVAANLYLDNGMARVKLHQPQKAITPGQSAVFYQGDTVLGGGIIVDKEDG